MPTVLVTGANRGLGLEFCRQYAARGWQVIAGCRQPEQAKELQKLSGMQSTIKVENLDVFDFDNIDRLSGKFASESIDVLINNAGVYDDKRGYGFGRLDYDEWIHSLKINTLAPVKMAEAFYPQLGRGDKKLIVNVSSLMGSMADNTSGGSYLYRSSKAALNAAMLSLSIDLRNKGVGVLLLHPGWVLTDMGGPNALINAQTSVTGMCSVIDNFDMVQSGAFLKYDGTTMPW